MESIDTNPAPRRFSGTQRLYGGAAFPRLQAAHVVVIGVGGVGSWAAECLARTGVGRLTLIDLDVVGESNINRQIHALDATLGANKVDVMAQRIASYAPHCRVVTVDEWITPDNVADLVPLDAACVVDCIDQVRSKTALAALCVARGQALVICGAAGGKTDLSQLAVGDLAHVTHDPLLAALRSDLRKNHGFAGGAVKGKPKKMGLSCVYIAQPVARPNDAAAANGGLNCAGYGSVMAVTASMGLRAAHEVVALFA
jgi:tRNA threonylcarbamoyladenosine dehydratase